MPAPKPSQRAIDLIIGFEVTSQAAYTKLYSHPIWPGGASGVTIGIGYDLGYASPAEIRAAWDPQVSAAMVAAMVSVAGLKGAPAKAALAGVKAAIDVPWAAASAVFGGVTLGLTSQQTSRALPNCDALSADSFGALVSLTYNRGASYTKSRDPHDPTDRYREMRAIQKAMAANNFAAIEGEILAMQRLWPGVAGLQRRRRAEAKLFKDGLA